MDETVGHEHDDYFRLHSKGVQDYQFDQPKRRGGDDWTEEEESGHKRHILEEAAAAYAMGRRLMEDKSHPIATLIAERLGAIAIFKEGKKYIAHK